MDYYVQIIEILYLMQLQEMIILILPHVLLKQLKKHSKWLLINRLELNVQEDVLMN